MAEAEPLLQYVQRGRTTWGARVFPDGHVDAFSDQEVDDDLNTRRVPLAWRPRAQLTATQIEQVREALRRSGFFALPARLEPAGRIHDAATTTWTAALDGRRHEVAATGSGQAHHPVLEGLRTTFEAMVAEALSRED